MTNQRLTPWLGRQDSNLGMAESKSTRIASAPNEFSEIEPKSDPSKVNSLASVSECERSQAAMTAPEQTAHTGRTETGTVRPLAIDLFCGLGGWTDGLLAEGYDVIGFDIERHEYGDHRYPALLAVQDVLTLHGSQFKNATIIVASPPCQEYSYMAMPWTRAKAKAAAIRADKTGTELERLNRLFNACFRIQREACEAAGRHIPLIVENVKGAQPWIGRARWSFGSFYLWGDVPALMPIVLKTSKVPGFRFDGSGKSFQSASVEHTGIKAPGMNWSDQTKRGQDFTRLAGNHATKNNGGSWFNIAHNTTSGTGQNPDGRKVSGDWFGSYADMKAKGTISPGRMHGKNSKKRKMASAMIAKIPLPLSRHIAATFASPVPARSPAPPLARRTE